MPEKWRALTLVSGWCGLRIAESAGLRRADVDLKAGLLRIVQTNQYVGTPARLVVGPPKSNQGVRTVHMPRHVTDALSDYIANRGRMKPKDLLWTQERRATNLPSHRAGRLQDRCQRPRATTGWFGTTFGTPQTLWLPTQAPAKPRCRRAWVTPTRRSARSTFIHPALTTKSSPRHSPAWHPPTTSRGDRFKSCHPDSRIRPLNCRDAGQGPSSCSIRATYVQQRSAICALPAAAADFWVPFWVPGAQ